MSLFNCTLFFYTHIFFFFLFYLKWGLSRYFFRIFWSRKSLHLSERIFFFQRLIETLRITCSVGWNTCDSQDRFKHEGSRRHDDRCRHPPRFHVPQLVGVVKGMEAPAWRTTLHCSTTPWPFLVLVARTHPVPRGSSPSTLPFLPTSQGKTLASSLAHVVIIDVRVRVSVCSRFFSHPRIFPLSLLPIIEPG